ncbi:MAG: hypothetical protein NZ927_08480 [Candidatus Calescibacterium sp.]|nr:hypothetical protein [Candidatus Calescibacterium sp.]
MFDKKRKKVLKVLFESYKKIPDKAYAVGGFPRDLLLGKYKFHDIDVVVFGDYKEFARILSSELKGSSIVDIEKYKIVRIFYKNLIIDVCAPKDRDLISDLKSRDFTIDTLVIPLENILDPINNIMDPLDIGKEDLKLHLLRTPVHPAITLKDDPGRIVRTARFIAEGFTPEQKLIEESRRRVRSLTMVPKERIGEELRKIFLAKKPSAGLFFLREIGFFEVLFPRIVPALYKDQKSPYHFEGVFEHCARVTDLTPPDIILRLSAFFHDIGKAYAEKQLPDGRTVYWGHEFISADICRDFLSTFKFPENEREKIIFIVKNHMVYYSSSWSDTAVRRLIKRLQPHIEDVLDFIYYDIKALKDPAKSLQGLDELKQRIKNEIIKLGKSEIKSPLDGNEIQEIFGLSEGKIIGKIKSAIENAIIEGNIKSTKEDAINFVRSILPQILQEQKTEQKQEKTQSEAKSKQKSKKQINLKNNI